jgi:hypothetical protein
VNEKASSGIHQGKIGFFPGNINSPPQEACRQVEILINRIIWVLNRIPLYKIKGFLV